MHYCISSVLCRKLQIRNTSEFLLGGVAPDAHPYMGVPKDVTHFIDRDEAGKGHVNYMRFSTKYKEYLHQPFYLGYLCHLISDDVWSSHTYYNIVAGMTREERKQTLPACYRDFWRLNGRMISAYSLTLIEYFEPTNLVMDEINVQSLPDLFDWIRKDFACNEETSAEQLELFDNDNSQITDYIDVAVDKCQSFISKSANINMDYS